MKLKAILCDYNNIIKPSKLDYLEQKLSYIPYTNSKNIIGLILIISEDEYYKLCNKSSGKDRINYLNHKNFVDNIYSLSYTIYNKKKDICEIISDFNYIDLIFSKVKETYLSSSIYVNIPFETNVEEYCLKFIELGFSHPYISRKGLLCRNYDSKGVSLLYNPNYPCNKEETKNNLVYVINQYNNKKCKVDFKLSTDTIKYLYNIPYDYDVEVSGRMIASKTDKDLEFNLILDYDNLNKGDNEEVSICDGLVSFHSHPKKTYKKHNVIYAWPSNSDYCSFIASNLLYGTILHMVISVEGIYVISLNPNLNCHIEVDDSFFDFVEKEYCICPPKEYKDNLISNYLTEINNKKYFGKTIFIINFYTWDKSIEFASFSFPLIDDNCFFCQKTYDIYNMIQKSCSK